MFEEVELQDGEDLADCGVKCEIHKSQCDFFAHSSNSQMLQLIQKCYFGIYTQTTGTVISVDEDIQTYHKTGKIFCHYNPVSNSLEYFSEKDKCRYDQK